MDSRNVFINIPRVAVGRIDPAPFSKLFAQEVENTRHRLVAAVGQGQDAHGKAQRKYSKGYKEAILSYNPKTGKGGVRSRKGGVLKPVSTAKGPANLRISGDMLNSIQTKTDPDGSGVVFFNDDTQSEKAATLMDRGFKNWFEFGQVDLDRIEKSATALLDKQLEKLFLPQK